MAKTKPTLNKKGKPRRTAEQKAANAKKYNNPTPRAQRGTKPATTKTLGQGAVTVKQQPDDPGADKLSLEELKASWATTPEWVKGALVIATLALVVAILF